MKCIGRLAVLALLGTALVGVPGCAQDNEDAAQITGVAPGGSSGGPQTYEKLGRPPAGHDRPAADYPGAR